jgi:hypothetical protein
LRLANQFIDLASQLSTGACFCNRMVAWHWPLPLTLTTRWLSTHQNSHILVNVSGRQSPSERDLLSCATHDKQVILWTLRNSLRLVANFPLSLPIKVIVVSRKT